MKRRHVYVNYIVRRVILNYFGVFAGSWRTVSQRNWSFSSSVCGVVKGSAFLGRIYFKNKKFWEELIRLLSLHKSFI
jgi:hypothetical protein